MQRHNPVLTPDVTLTRTTVNDILRNNAKVARAIEIISQLCFIQNNWTLRELPVPFDIHPEKLMEELTKSTYSVDDILNSRGWWTYDKKHPLPYLSIFDILGIVNNTYKPKFFSVKKAA
jgi:hypothetical protein